MRFTPLVFGSFLPPHHTPHPIRMWGGGVLCGPPTFFLSAPEASQTFNRLVALRLSLGSAQTRATFVCLPMRRNACRARGAGEALSIREMVEHAVAAFGTDRRKVFVTGLSAGGAMGSVMLATYPEVFAGGAIIAGLPYGCADNVQQALEAMFTGAGICPTGAWRSRACGIQT